MKHLIVLEVCETTKDRISETIQQKGNIYNIEALETRGSLENGVKNIMAETHMIPIKVGDSVFILCGENTIREEHVVVSVLQKRFSECIQLFVVRESNKEVEIPHELRCFIEQESRDKTYASTNFSSPSGGCGGCGGGCSSCG